MKVDELKGEARRRGLQVSGTKRALQSRIADDDAREVKRVFVTNRDESIKEHSEAISYEFLAAGAFRNVFQGVYTKGPRAGEKCVKKVFKSGAVYESKFFDKDVAAVDKAGELIARFNQEMRGKVNKQVKLNKREVWQDKVADYTGKQRRLLVEPFIEGDYIKFNSKTGYAQNDCELMHRCMAEDLDGTPCLRARRRRLQHVRRKRIRWSDAGLRAVCGALNAGTDASRPSLVTLRFSKKVTSRRQWFEWWSDAGLRAVCSALNAGTDASRPSLVTLRFSKKVTSRRQWFEDLARAVASPMGVELAANRANGCFGRTGHNGVALCVTPAASVVAAVITALIAEAAHLALHLERFW